MFYKTVGKGPFVLQDGAEYTGRFFWMLHVVRLSARSALENAPVLNHMRTERGF